MTRTYGIRDVHRAVLDGQSRACCCVWAGKTVGVVGTGRIGAAFAQIMMGKLQGPI